jgi:putative transposase
MGLVLAVCVHTAALQDRRGARAIEGAVAPNVSRSMRVVWADQGYTGAFAPWPRETRGWRLEVVRPPDRQLVRHSPAERPAHTFRVLPRGWVVERRFARLARYRRLTTRYERLVAMHRAFLHLGRALICLNSRRRS